MSRFFLTRIPRPWHLARLAGTSALGTWLVTELLDQYVVTTHFVTGPSMEPALSPRFDATGARDLILLARPPLPSLLEWGKNAAGEEEEAARSGMSGGLRRGDVVCMSKPHDPASPSSSVKRVLALPGDRVVRDAAARGPNEGASARRLGMAAMPAELVVPPGHVWVEGDGWRNSLDSNDFGAVPINLVTGRAVMILWPPSRFGRIPPRVEERRGTKIVPGDAVAREYNWERQLEFR